MSDEPMIVRDPRWENVWAYVLPKNEVDRFFDESRLDGLIQFRIEIVYDGVRYWQNQIIHENDFDYTDFNAYKFILDKMVEQLDKRLDGELDDD